MSPPRADKPGAVVVGAGYRALPLVRSLGRRGIDVWVLRTDEHQVAWWSRYTSRRVALGSEDPAALVPDLVKLAGEHGLDGWALLPTVDDDAATIARHADELGRYYRLGTASHETVQWAIDKAAASALAIELGVDVPRSWPARTAEALDDPAIRLPAIIKPTFRPRGIATTTPKAWKAEDPDGLHAAYAEALRVLAPEHLMVQELIPGGGEDQLAYAALCSEGEVLASIAVRRTRQWPLEFGLASTFVESIEDDEIARPARRLLAATNYTGLVEVEFKRDRRDGRLALLDVNPRPWGWIALGAAAGVDFPYLYWQLLMGEHVQRVRGRPGVRWVRLSTDIPAAIAGQVSGALTVQKWLHSLRPPLACAIFASDDVVPALLDAPILMTIAMRRGLAKIRERLRARRPPIAQAAPQSTNGRVAPRALIIVENSPVPGDRRVWHEALALRNAGWDVTILAPHAWRAEPRGNGETIEGVRIRRFELTPAENRRFGHLAEYSTAMWRIWRAIRELAKERPFDIIHGCNPPDFLLLAAVGQRRHGTRLVFDHHDLAPEMYANRSESHNRIAHWGLLMLERLAFRLADVSLATNGSVGQLAVERDHADPERVFVVRNGPMLERFTPVEPDRSLARGRKYLLVYVGLMGPQDGVEQALYALSHLLHRRDDWHARFIGTGEMLPDLERLSARLGIQDHVEFCGYKPDPEVRLAISSADVCLAPDPRNPYTDRSTLVKIAEYMALERPLVSFDLTESKVTAGDAALFASDNDPVQFAERIDQLLNDPELRRKLGAEGRARVEREFAWDHSERALLAAYNRALGRLPSDAGSGAHAASGLEVG
jgi:predicted ATP-grasp superfamily ATP-dependent carboligase/glycosyltransferase involved in cell wall biosynthesis